MILNTVKLLVDVSLGQLVHDWCFMPCAKKIRDRVRACTGCQRYKVYHHVVSPIVSCKMPTARLNTVHADLCGPYPACQ